MQLPAMPRPRPSPAPSSSPPFHSPVSGSLTDGTVITQCTSSMFLRRWSFFSSSATPALASASEAVGSMLPALFTRTVGIWAIGVLNVLGWHPAGSLEKSTHCAASGRLVAPRARASRNAHSAPMRIFELASIPPLLAGRYHGTVAMKCQVSLVLVHVEETGGERFQGH